MTSNEKSPSSGERGLPENACSGITSKGRPCKMKPLPGERFCAIHMTEKEKKNPEKPEKPLRPPVKLEASFPESLAELFELLKRRGRGDYKIDEWGWDEELTALMLPLARWIYRKYWRVKATGLENVPSEGRALMVANHSGVLPFDGAMVWMSIMEDHPDHRMVRALVLSLFFGVPFTAPLLHKFGQVQASPANSERLLNQDQLTLVFPEGVKGIGKPFRRRYQLARFGRGGFVRVALNTKSPIIPVSIVGAEESYPMLMNFKPLAQLMGIPYFPITPTFPFLGPLGLLPLPTRWHIHFDKPIHIEDMKYQRSEEPLLVTKISNQVRDSIQRNIYEILKTRRSIFW